MPADAAKMSSDGSGAADDRALILLYHRVARLDADPQLLAVEPRRFERHVAFLREHATPLSLTELVERLADGSVPERAVALTFDDGYADNYEEAAPILHRHGVPATVFVTTSGLAAHREYWWDDLERILLATPSELPDDVTILVGGVQVRIPGGAYRPRAEYAAWTVLDADAPTARHAAYRAVCETIRPLNAECRDTVIDRIEKKLGLSRVIRPTHRAMNADRLRRLAHDGLIEIGAHTLTHPVLAALPLDAQQQEIVESKRILEDALGSPMRAFSYPFGGRRDYTAETVQCVRAAAFACACANVHGPVRADSDPWQLPRVLVRDWSGDEFAARIESLWSSDESVVARSAS